MGNAEWLQGIKYNYQQPVSTNVCTFISYCMLRNVCFLGERLVFTIYVSLDLCTYLACLNGFYHLIFQASSYPAASITWWTNGEKLEGATEMIVDGAYGGFVTSSHLQLSLTPQHHGVVVTCDASNDIGNHRAHDAVTLSIARKCTKKI